MEKSLEIMKRSVLFDHMEPDDVLRAITDLKAYQADYRAREMVLRAGDRPTAIGLMLTGAAQVCQDGVDGRRTILSELRPGDLFAEALAGAGVRESHISVEATAPCRILFLPFDHLREKGANHGPLVFNMLTILARKNLYLTDKIGLLSQGSIRERLLSYFYQLGAGEGEVVIPFNREALAGYISANRSAMCRELGKMQREGILTLENRRVRVHRWV